MAAAASFGKAGRVGLPVGAPDHTARTRQRLEMVYCTPAEDGRTPMGDVSDYAAHHASLSRQAGIDPKLVADQLGHGLGVNLDVYTVAALDKRQDAVEVLESALATAVRIESP